ncbi:helix-turn-helix domain-containing protein [Natrinema soli]|uniref:Helix-turn-helix domain-containing protein n=1 Tax=Natrinema soli TaxID=1930624 RepID=A0ABD5SF61_9EURY|nr:helix-turn-helix domain-containing protein [Natrinema soli]
MADIVEFTIQAKEFQFGQVLTRGPRVNTKLERVIPVGRRAAPYIWVETNDVGGFEEAIQAEGSVKNLKRIDEINGRSLYRIWWQGRNSLFTGILRTNGMIIQASGGNVWKFRLLFSDRDNLRNFHRYCVENGITMNIEAVYTLTKEEYPDRMFGLTSDQEEALVKAAGMGYFESPSKVSLREVGNELGISSQATSKRIRGGVEKLVTNVLLTPN